MDETTKVRPTSVELGDLDTLEAESMFIIREVAAEFEHPVMLFSGGKDSVLMLQLARKAFAPAPVPFPIMHVDTGHNFPEVIAFRDKVVEEYGLRLEVAPGKAPALTHVYAYGEPALYRELLEDDSRLRFLPPLPREGIHGAGVVHHVAWRIGGDEGPGTWRAASAVACAPNVPNAPIAAPSSDSAQSIETRGSTARFSAVSDGDGVPKRRAKADGSVPS